MRHLPPLKVGQDIDDLMSFFNTDFVVVPGPIQQLLFHILYGKVMVGVFPVLKTFEAVVGIKALIAVCTSHLRRKWEAAALAGERFHNYVLSPRSYGNLKTIPGSSEEWIY